MEIRLILKLVSNNERGFHYLCIGYTFSIDPYCVKLYENGWYILGKNNRDEIRLYIIDRIEEARIVEGIYRIPKNFNALEYFAPHYEIATGYDIKPPRIVIRANEDHKYFVNFLPLHDSQKLIEDYSEYADFELVLAHAYNFVMKLLQFGNMIEVIS